MIRKKEAQSVYSFIDSQNLNLGVRDQGGVVKGNVDAELVLHAMIEWSNYDKAVIVTGDGDFYCLVDYLHKKKKLLRLLAPNAAKYSTLLRPLAPNLIDFVSHLRVKLEWKGKESERQSYKDKTLRTSSHRD